MVFFRIIKKSKTMKLIVYISLMFILYELLKAIMVDAYWRVACMKVRSLPIRILDFIYVIFLIYLCFVSYWYVSVAILIISVITALQTTDDIIEKTAINKRIRGYLIADNITSILFLLLIVFKEIRS
jgi:hypothetical protein